MRNSLIERNTSETAIRLSLSLDGNGNGNICTGCGFLDHMLSLFARHGRFDLTVDAKGDIQVDYHHLAEDVGIVLGRAFGEALGEMRGIRRYGSLLLPMDEALVMVAIDISGRAMLAYHMEIPTQKVGDFDTELVEEFLRGFVRAFGITLHVRQMSGTNSHHIIEALFKGLGQALRQAVEQDPRSSGEIPSTKGTIL